MMTRKILRLAARFRATQRKKAKFLRWKRHFAIETLEPRQVMAAGLDPVILIPGLGGTFAQNESPAGLAEWYTNRGLAPNKLALESFDNTYQNIVKSLENVGYVSNGPGQNLFVGLWDWRLPIAPVDGTALTAPDGRISSATTTLISDGVFATGLDYLGNLLNQIKTANPSVTKVDVIAHGAGGLVARSYLQSAAYTQNILPKIDDLVMVGVPNQGLSEVWNYALDDWSKDGATEVTSRIVKRAYDIMRSGTPIQTVGVAGSTINNVNIALPAFAQQYVGSLRNLLPTYDAIDTDADGTFEKLSSTNPVGNTLVNNLLTDLNGGAINAWVNATGKTTVLYATELSTADQIVAQVGPSVDGFARDGIVSFTNLLGSRPNVAELWYEDVVSGHGGDGTVPAYSSIDPLLDDPRIGIKLKLTPVSSAAAGGNAVDHQGLIVNPFAQTKILQAVGATNITTLESSLTKTSAAKRTKLLTLGVTTPLDAIRTAAVRFKEFLTDVKTEGALNGSIAYIGTKLGSLMPIDSLWQDRIIAPLTSLVTANPNATIEQIVAVLGSAVSVEVSSANEKSLRFNFNASHFTGGVPSVTVSSLSLGSSANLASTSSFAFTGNLQFSGVLGLDLTEGNDWSDSLFVRDLSLLVGGSANIPTLNAGISIGPITASVEDGSFALNAQAQVAIENPLGGTKVTLNEVLDGLSSLSSFVTITPTASLDLRFPLNLTNSATNFNLANFGRPIVTAASENLFAGIPDVMVDIELGPAIQDQLLSVMASLDKAADDVSSQSVFSKVIPGIGKSLNALINPSEDGSKKFGDLIKLEKAAQNYFSSFDPSSPTFSLANVGKKPSVLGMRNALTAKIKQVAETGFTIGSESSPISLSGGLDLTANRLTFDLRVNPSFDTMVDLNFDALGSQWTDTGVTFSADAKVNVSTSLNLQAQFGVGLSRATGIDPFFTLNQFEVNASIDGAGSSIEFGLGNGTITGTATATKLGINAGAIITVANTAGPLRDRIKVTPVGNLDVDFEFNASLYGTPLGTAPNLPSIMVVDTNIFDAAPPTFTVDMSPLALNLSAESIINGLISLASWLDNATGSTALDAKVPLVNKTVGEILSTVAEPRVFESHQILSITPTEVVDGFKQFTVQLNLAGKTVSSLGVRPRDKVKFLATDGERFEAEVESVDGESVTLRYEESRTDEPDLLEPSLTFEIGGSLSSMLRAAMANYSSPEAAVPSLGKLLNDLAEPLGITFDDVEYNSTTKKLTITPTFTPKPIEFTSRLDFAEKIPGLAFNASGDFLITAAPTIRLPIEINLASDPLLTLSNRVAVIDDALPEVNLAITAQLDNPQARASLGFLTVRLSEDTVTVPAINPNAGIVFSTDLSLNIKDPLNNDGRATIGELLNGSNLAASFVPGFSGSFDIDGLMIKPEIAGTPIPGDVRIFTTTTPGGATRGPAPFANIAQLKTLLNNISVTNTIGKFDSLTPEEIVTMFVQLGDSVQSIASTLDIPDGIPFVKDAVSGIVDFSKTAQNFARQLYFNPKLIGAEDISVTNGRLTQDATFAIRIENGEPIFVTIPAISTATNESIDDLYEDINQAFVAQGLDSQLIADRLKPFEGSSITSITNITATAVPSSVQPLPVGFVRYRAVLASPINLFNLGLRVGDMIEFLDTNGFMQTAAVDEMNLTSIAFRYAANPDIVPDVSTTRSINIYDPELANRLVIRTTNPTAGISMQLSTVQITAEGDLPSQLAQDLSFKIIADGTEFNVSIPAASTKQNGQPSDMLASFNLALANTDLDGGSLDEKLRGVLIGDQLRIVNVDGVTQDLRIEGGAILGFAEEQDKDINTARTELGLSSLPADGDSADVASYRDGMLATPSFRANTIQDLVHLLNGVIQEQFAGQPFSASLNYSATPVRTITFNLAIGATFEKTVELDFNKGFDVGFTQLSIAGGAQATITADAGVELTVGIDLDPVGANQVVTSATKLADLNKGRGVQVKVGRLGNPVNSSGKNSPETALTLAFAVRRFGNLSSNVSVTVPALEVSDNASLQDLAADLSSKLRTVSIPGLSSLTGLPALEVQAVDGRLLLVANAKEISGLTINNSTTSAFLGFGAGSTSQPDLAISLRNGTSFSVDLDSSESLGDIKSKIETAAGGPAILEVTFVNDQIRLQDKTAQVGESRFKVVATSDNNGISPIGSNLGIVAEVAPVVDEPNTPADETNAGDILLGTSLLRGAIIDQFYVKTSGSRAYANVTIESSDIDLIASLGILDLGIEGGTMNFSINAGINMVDLVDDPGTVVNEATNGKLRLRDFTSAGLGKLIQPTFTYGGDLNLPINGSLLTFLPPEYQAGGSKPLVIEASIANQPGSLKPNLSYGVSNLQEALAEFKNFSIADLVGVIQRVVEMLQSSDLDGLNTPIPVINKTPNDVLDVIGGLADAAAELLKGPRPRSHQCQDSRA